MLFLRILILNFFENQNGLLFANILIFVCKGKNNSHGRSIKEKPAFASGSDFGYLF